MYECGIGFRSQHFDELLRCPASQRPQFLEIITDNLMASGDRYREKVYDLSRTYPLAFHGVGLSIAGKEWPRADYLCNLQGFVKELKPTFVSDHLCWSSHNGQSHYDLLPLPYTDSMCQVVSDRVKEVQDFLGRRLYLENPSAYLLFQENTHSEDDFLSQVCHESDCGILLDLNNLWVNNRNLGLDLEKYLKSMQGLPICYFHIAGHRVLDDIRIDTHDAEVCQEVWRLYEDALKVFGFVPSVLEWDGDIPEFADLMQTVDHARNIALQIEPPPLEKYTAKPRKDDRTKSFPSRENLAHDWKSSRKQSVSGMENTKLPQAISAKIDRLAALVTEPCLPKTFNDELFVNSAFVNIDRGLKAYRDNLRYGVFDLVMEAYPTLVKILGEDELFDLHCEFLSSAHRPEDLSRVVLPFAEFMGNQSSDFSNGGDQDTLYHVALFDRVFYELGLISPEKVKKCQLDDLKKIPNDFWPDVKVKFIKNLNNLALNCSPHIVEDDCYRKSDFFKDSNYVIYPQEDGFSYKVLDDWEWKCLQLFLTGKTLGEVLDSLSRNHELDDHTLFNRCFQNILDWIGNGMIIELKICQHS